MKVRILSIFVVACLGLIGLVQATGAGGGSGGSPIQELYPDQDLVQDLSAFITTHMPAAKVPGLSIALIQGGQIRWVEGFGVANSLAYALTMGLACGYLMMKTNNIWGAVLIHAAADLFAFIATLANA